MTIAVDTVWRPIVEQTKITTSASSQQSAAFSAQTYCVRLGVASSTIANGVHYSVGTNPTATANSPLIPADWVEFIRVAPGEKIALLQEAGALVVTITEMDR